MSQNTRARRALPDLPRGDRFIRRARTRLLVRSRKRPRDDSESEARDRSDDPRCPARTMSTTTQQRFTIELRHRLLDRTRPSLTVKREAASADAKNVSVMKLLPGLADVVGSDPSSVLSRDLEDRDDLPAPLENAMSARHRSIGEADVILPRATDGRSSFRKHESPPRSLGTLIGRDRGHQDEVWIGGTLLHSRPSIVPAVARRVNQGSKFVCESDSSEHRSVSRRPAGRENRIDPARRASLASARGRGRPGWSRRATPKLRAWDALAGWAAPVVPCSGD